MPSGYKLMASGRFDGGEKERFLRDTVDQLKQLGEETLVVQAGGGDTFGGQTMRCLDAMDIMVAFAYEDYGEQTGSAYCSYAEIEYCISNHKRVIPVKLYEGKWPPLPGGAGDAQNKFFFKPDLVFIDGVGKPPAVVAQYVASAASGTIPEAVTPMAGGGGGGGGVEEAGSELDEADAYFREELEDEGVMVIKEGLLVKKKGQMKRSNRRYTLLELRCGDPFLAYHDATGTGSRGEEPKGELPLAESAVSLVNGKLCVEVVHVGHKNHGKKIFFACPDGSKETCQEWFTTINHCKTNNVEQVVEFMRQQKDVEMQLVGCARLYSISNNEGLTRDDMMAKITIVKAGSVASILSAMQSHGGSAAVQELGCGALGNLMRYRKITNSQLPAGTYHLGSYGGIYDVLWDVPRYCSTMRAVLEAGSVASILSAMQGHGGSAAVQLQGFAALNELMSITQCRRYMNDCATEQKAKAAAKRAAAATAEEEGLARAEELAEEAAALAAQVVSDWKERMRAIFDLGGAEVMVSALQGHRGSTAVQEAGKEALERFTDGPDYKFTQAVFDIGGSEFIDAAE